jgi:hypothetical protein
LKGENEMFRKESDPFEFLLRALNSESNDSIIRGQEKQGQAEFVRSEVLPKQINLGTREQFEKMGIIFGEDADDLFVEVVLPPGWKKVATDHDMWSHLVDDKGRDRAAIFFKAAFYDRYAHLSIERRFSYSSVPTDGWDEYVYGVSKKCGVVTDCGKVIFKTEDLDPETFPGKRYEMDDALYFPCKKWLEEHYPDWEDPLAYWD